MHGPDSADADAQVKQVALEKHKIMVVCDITSQLKLKVKAS